MWHTHSAHCPPPTICGLLYELDVLKLRASTREPRHKGIPWIHTFFLPNAEVAQKTQSNSRWCVFFACQSWARRQCAQVACGFVGVLLSSTSSAPSGIRVVLVVMLMLSSRVTGT